MENIEYFKKRSGTTDRGGEYEDVVRAFVILKLIKDVETKNFHVSSNEEGFGAFDDIVIKTESNKGNKIKAVQLKHNKNKILSTRSLMSKTGDFSILKYFKCFQEIKKEVDELILFTNGPFKCDDNTTIQLEEEEFSIIPVKVKAASELADIDCAYQFKIIEEDWNVEMLLKIREYQKFFSKFYLYTDQKKVENLKNNVAENFKTTYYSDEEIFEKFLKRLIEWKIKEGNKEKLNKEWVERVIALLLLCSYIEPLYSGSINVNSVNDKMKIFREAVSLFDITLLERESYEKLKPVWDDIIKEKKFDFRELNKVRKRYFPAVSYIDNKNIDKIDPRIFIQLLWLTDKCPLIIRQHENVEKAIQLCSGKKFILIGEGKNEEWMENYTVFQDLSNLKQKHGLREILMHNFTISIQGKGELNLATAFDNSEEFLESVTTDKLVEMLHGPCYIGGQKEILPEPYVERSLSRNIINIKYLDKFWENTIIILNCADNFDKVKDKVKQCKLIVVNNFLQKKNQNFENQKNKLYICNPTQYKNNFHSDKSNFTNSVYISNSNFSELELEQIYNENREAKQFHYFKLSSDCNLEWVKSKGDVSDLEVYKLHEKYCTNENKLWCSRLDNNINLICGDPGMGKTELMKSCKNKCSPKHWTIIISPNDVHSFFYNSKFSKTSKYTDLFEKFIVNKNSRSLKGFERRFFEMCVEKNNVVYVWDALDEIVGECLEAVTKIIIGFSAKRFLQWVTSRKHLKPFLEKKFNVLALSINQFDEQEQQNYVRKRLSSFISVDEIEIVIEKIKSSFAIIEHVNILGIPLQIFMVTELFRQNSDKYLKLMENIFLLTDLYEYFIDEKFNNFYRDKLVFNFKNPHMVSRSREEKQEILGNYERVALKVIFSEEVLKRLNVDCEQHKEKILEKCVSIGLVSEFENDVPHFVHGSFAEYLAATYFSKNLNIFYDILGDLMFNPKYNNVRFFFDMLLVKNCKAHIAVLYKKYELLKTYDDETLTRKDKGGRSALHVISSWGQRHSRIKITVENGKCIVHEDSNFDRQAENEAYFETVIFLQSKNNVEEHDSLLDATPLSYAKKSESLGAEIILLQAKNKELNRQANSLNDNVNILYYSSLLGYDQVCELLITQEMKTRENRGYDTKFVTAENAETPLLLASKSGHIKIVKYLLYLNDEMNKPTKLRETPFHFAPQNGYKNTLEYFLNVGEEISCRTFDSPFGGLVKPGPEINRGNKHGETPLFVASEMGHEKVVECLAIAGAEINRAQNSGWIPLHIASFNGHEKVVEYLATVGAEINSANKNGVTSLYIASQNGHKKVVEYLVTVGAEINRAKNDGATPLYVASQNGHEKVVEYLATVGAEINRAMNGGATPLYIASQKGHEEVVEYLVTVGAEINRATNDGVTPLYVASFNGHEKVVEYLATVGAEINGATNDGVTPLYIASQKGHESVVEYLATVGAEINNTNKNGATPLFIASQNGHENVVAYLVTIGAEINRAMNDGATPLYIASQNGHEKVVEYLATVGAEINRATNDGVTPLYVASFNGHEKVVEYLATVGAEINCATNDGMTPLFIASQNGHEKVVDYLLAIGAEINRATNNGVTPLYIASQNGNEKIVEYLATVGAEINCDTNDGMTPLFIASQNGNEKVVQYLATVGAEINCDTNDGMTPLFIASHNGHEKVVDYLLAIGAEINRPTNNGVTPLYIASQNGNEKVVQYLATVGAEINCATNDGMTPLFIASQNGHEKVVEYLATFGAEINSTMNDGWTPLHTASYNGHEKVVESLATVGGVINHAENDGVTPLYLGSQNGHEKVVEYLTTAGAEINRTKRNGATPLYIASQNGHEKVVEYLATAGAEINRAKRNGATPLYTASQNGHKKVVEYLVTVGAEINRANKTGATPLYVASQNGHEKVVEYLATAGAEINRAQKIGATPLHIASWNGHEKVVEYLGTVGAEINRATNNGWTPLHIASQNGHERIVEYLVTVGAEINRANKNGWTPLYIASQNGHKKVVEYLKKVGASRRNPTNENFSEGSGCSLM
ncbi:uncharacterized protein LOC135123364 [Zophobas morio]|uniref:uncharacterized protein LOC135123364 n=1 Tax=Zophobas morio TaxID=2755281 RepID=UPI0030835ADE